MRCSLRGTDQGGTVEVFSPLTVVRGVFLSCFPLPVAGRAVILEERAKEGIVMKFSSKIEKCGLSPMRKFYPYEVAAGAKGVTVRGVT